MCWGGRKKNALCLELCYFKRNIKFAMLSEGRRQKKKSKIKSGWISICIKKKTVKDREDWKKKKKSNGIQIKPVRCMHRKQSQKKLILKSKSDTESKLKKKEVKHFFFSKSYIRCSDSWGLLGTTSVCWLVRFCMEIYELHLVWSEKFLCFLLSLDPLSYSRHFAG